MLMTKTNISTTLPSLLHCPLGNVVTSFHAVTQIPSSLESPIPGDPSIGKDSSHQKIQNLGISLPQNHHTSHNMLMEINWHYWVLVSHYGPASKVLYRHIVACSNFFHCYCSFFAIDFNHPIKNSCASYTKHITSIRFKINWNNFK